jgi:hypothetical protein
MIRRALVSLAGFLLMSGSAVAQTTHTIEAGPRRLHELAPGATEGIEQAQDGGVLGLPPNSHGGLIVLSPGSAGGGYVRLRIECVDRTEIANEEPASNVRTDVAAVERAILAWLARTEPATVSPGNDPTGGR